MMTLSAIQQAHGRLLKLPEFRKLPAEKQRRILSKVCDGSVPQHELAILREIGEAAINASPET